MFEVPESKASIKQNQFKFKLSTGEKYSLPKMQYLSSDMSSRMQEIGGRLKQAIDSGGEASPEDVAELAALQRELFETYAPGLYERTTNDQIEAIQAAWQQASGITLGESSPSAD